MDDELVGGGGQSTRKDTPPGKVVFSYIAETESNDKVPYDARRREP